MIEKNIIEEFKKHDIVIYRLDKVTNSYSSNVYIAYSKTQKYIFKILYNEEKQKGEAMYIKYISDKVNAPKLVFSGSINDKSYNVITFIEGKSYSDSDIELLSDEQIFKIGILLGKLHTIKPLDKNNESWINYLYKYAEKSNKNLENVLDNNEKIYGSIINSIESIKGTYENVILHLDFRVGNIIFGDKEYLIDFESMKSGDPAFDFLKMKRILSDEKFDIFMEGYKNVKNIDNSILERINFYNIFDAYTAVNWCYERNKLDSDFCKESIKILKKEFK